MLRIATPAAGDEAVGGPTIVRDFDDPYLELVRLVREASEIEHALLVQYLYASFSVKDAYSALRGTGSSAATSILGVAIQEMQHLEQVNRLLADLHAAPNLVRQDFPYEPDIYPFELNLEPLSRESVAKYVFTEAPANRLDPDDPINAGAVDQQFIAELTAVLHGHSRPNHLGALYGRILTVLDEVIAAAVPGVGDLSTWKPVLLHIQEQGEGPHYLFFRSVFMGDPSRFAGQVGVWALDPADAAYPSRDIGTNPSAFEGHPNAIADPAHRRIAWLTNLHYWLVLGLLDLGYRTGNADVSAQAVQHMTTALRPLGTQLATLGVGAPFDPLSMGYAPGHDVAGTVLVLRRLVAEAAAVATGLGAVLSVGPLLGDLTDATLTVLDGVAPASPAIERVAAPAPVPPDTVSADFWFDFDNAFANTPTQAAVAAMTGIGDMDVLRATFAHDVTAGTFPASYVTTVTPVRPALAALSALQLDVFDARFGKDDDLQRVAFEHFGQGDLFDDRRPDNPVHMMDISGPQRPPIGYHRWHAILRAMTLLDVDADRWQVIGRHLALAWAVQSEARPQQGVHNPPLPAARLAVLRTHWLARTPDEIDAAFAAGLRPPPVP